MKIIEIILKIIQFIVSIFEQKQKIEGQSVPVSKPNTVVKEVETRLEKQEVKADLPKAVTPKTIPPTPQETKVREILADKNKTSAEKIKDILEERKQAGSKLVAQSIVQKKEESKKIKLAWVVCHEKVAQGATFALPIKDEKGKESKISEYVYWTIVSNLAKQIVKEEPDFMCVDLKVITRDGWGIPGAYRLAKAWKADYIIEPHFNAFNGKASGTETLSTNETTDIELATIVHRNLCGVFDRQGDSRGVKVMQPKDRGGVNVYAGSQIPNCLPEPFFGDNLDDAKMAWANKKGIVRAILRAHIEHSKTKGV